MFFHILAGALIFWIFGLAFLGISKILLLFGVFVAVLPDIPYWFWLIRKRTETGRWIVDKNSHKHRNGFIHSVFFPFVLIPFAFLINPDMMPAIFLASLSHPLLDAWGIGWGVALFYPISDKVFKIFYQGKIVKVFTPEELKKHVKKNGEDDWWRKVYIKFNAEGLPSWYGKADWIALGISILILLIV